MLPYRTDLAILPIVQYGPGQPPFVPQIVVHPQVQTYLPEVASAIVNELGLKAYSNATRMFAYNMFSENVWNNSRFVDLVLFTCDAIACNLVEGKISSPQQGLYDTVSQCITMVVSGLMFEFPDLKSGLQPNVLDAAMQNVQVCSDLKNKINITLKKGNTMYNNPYQQPQQPQPQPYTQQPYGQPPVQGGYPQQPYGQPPMQGGYPQQPYGQPGFVQPMVDQYGRPVAMPQQMPPGYYQQQPQINQAAGRWATQTPNQQNFGSPVQAQQQNIQQNPISQAETFGKFSQQQATQTSQQTPEPVVAGASREDWKPSENQPYLSNFDPLVYRDVYRREKDGSVVQELEKVDMLDRNKHRTVLSCIPIKPDLEEKAIEVAKRDIVNRQLHEKTQNQAIVCDYVLSAENTVEEAILDSYAKWIKQQKANKEAAYRCYAIVSNALVSKTSTKEFLDSFSDCQTLTALSTRIRSVAEALKMWSEDSKTETLAENVSYLTYVDNILTEVINSFIHNNLSLENLSIDSFIEDYPELRRYLASSYGDRYSMALQNFDQQAMSSLMLMPEKDIVEVLEYNIVDGIEGVELFVNFAPMVCSFTFTHLTSKELGVNNKGKCAEMIIKDKNPVLYNLAETLFDKNSKGDLANIVPTYNYLITRDNVRYKLYNGYIGMDCYLIGK